MTLLILLAALGLSLVHLFAGKLRFLDGIPRSRWLSFAGGTSVAYVFLHLLPEVSEGQEVIAQAADGVLGFFEHHVYFVAFIGLTTFYGLERIVRASRREQQKTGEGKAGARVFWLHIASFSVFNALVGYLLVQRSESSPQSLLFFFVAMALHFVVSDFGLRQDHKDNYGRVGRWILAAAVFVGWSVGYFTHVSELMLSVLLSFLAGGIILNVLKEELPEERESRFPAFVFGGATYATLLLLSWL
jgi:zinc transporter ZupT